MDNNNNKRNNNFHNTNQNRHVSKTNTHNPNMQKTNFQQPNDKKSKTKEGLIIYQKYLELIYYTNDILRKYPKSEKFGLTTELKKNLYQGLTNMIYSIKTYNKQEKLTYLNKIDINLTLLKIHVRLSYKYKYITLQNYENWSNLIININNMLGAWIIACQKK